jgi:predicted transcriptional regulator
MNNFRRWVRGMLSFYIITEPLEIHRRMVQDLDEWIKAMRKEVKVANEPNPSK